MAAAALLALAVAGRVLAQQPAFFPVEQVSPGLVGYGLTVVEGTRIDRFDVEVLGLVKGAGPAGDLVLVRVSGPAVEPFGGIAAGMSGSPVYVDGKLLGAIGFAFEFSDHSVGLVTPIGDMLEVLRRVPQEGPPASASTAQAPPRATATASSGPAPLGPPAFQRVTFAADEQAARELAKLAPAGTAVMVPVATPVMVSGFGPRAQEALRRLFAPYRLMFVPGGGVVPAGATGASGGQEVALEPGSAFGVSLVHGDVNLTAIGTVTYVDGARFVGFGHPFLQKGTVDFFAGPAVIHRTVKSLSVPFKLGSMLGEPRAVLSEDRRAAVAGRTGVTPDAIGISVTVEDVTGGRTRTLRARVVRDDMLTVPLMAITALEALDRGLDRIGPGTARVIYRIKGRELPGSGVFARDHMDYSAFDISARLLGDFLGTLQTLLSNRFQDIGVTSVELHVQVSQARQTARIVRARPLTDQARPGDRVGVEVELRPFRGQPEVRIMTLEIPQDAAPGTISVTVRGGTPGTFSLGPELESLLTGQEPPASPGQEEEEPSLEEEQEPPSSLDKLIEALEAREKSNELVAEFYPGISEAHDGASQPAQADPPGASRTARKPGGGSSDKGTSTKEEAGRTATGAIKRTLITPWVIEGSTSFDLEIVEPDQEAPAGDEGAEAADSSQPQ